MHVERDRNELARNGLDERVTLLVGSELEKALRQVVGKGVDHQLGEVREDLVEDHVTVLRIAILELLLQVAASELIFAKRQHVCASQIVS